MTPKQLHKQLIIIHKDLTKVETRMMKISEALDIDRHDWLERTLWEIETLIKVYEERNNGY